MSINRVLFAGLLATTLVVSSGCGDILMTFQYNKKDEYGRPISTDVIENNYLKYIKIVVFNEDGEEVIHLCQKDYGGAYWDMFGGKVLHIPDLPERSLEIIEEYELIDYLVVNGLTQSEYTEPEFRTLLEQIKADFEMQEEKIKSLEN